MGMHICMIFQKKIDGKWRHLTHIPFEHARVPWFTYKHFNFMAYGGSKWSNGSVLFEPEMTDYAICHNRGLPKDFDATQEHIIEYVDPLDPDWWISIPGEDTGGNSWLFIDELVSHDYDRTITYIGDKENLREHLTQEFIDYWKMVQSLGAERVVFGLS